MRILPHNRLHVHVVPIALIAVFMIGIAAAAVSIAVYPKGERLTRLSSGLTGKLIEVEAGKHGTAAFTFAEPVASQNGAQGISGVESLGDTSRHTFLIHSAAAETAAKAAQAQANQQLLSKTTKTFRAR